MMVCEEIALFSKISKASVELEPEVNALIADLESELIHDLLLSIRASAIATCTAFEGKEFVSDVELIIAPCGLMTAAVNLSDHPYWAASTKLIE